MSEQPDAVTNANTEPSAIHSKKIKIPINYTPPEQITSTHVDNALVAIDHSTQMVTITLLSSHPVPKYSDGWSLDMFQIDTVGEIKIPVAAMTQMAVYYLTAMSGGIDVLRITQLEMQKQGKETPTGGFSYGPFAWTQSKGQPNDKQ